MATSREYWPESRAAVSGSQSRLHHSEERISPHLVTLSGNSSSIPPIRSRSAPDKSVGLSDPMQRWLHETDPIQQWLSEKPSETSWSARRSSVLSRVSFVGSNKSKGGHELVTNESSRQQGFDLPAPAQPAEASSSEHSNLSDLDEDFLSPSTWINKQKQTEEEVWSGSFLHYLQRFRALDTTPSLTTLIVDTRDGSASRFPLKDLSSIRCLEGQVQELLSAAPTLAFYDLEPRSGQNPASGIDSDLSMKELIQRFEDRPEAATEKLARRIPASHVRRIQSYESAYLGLSEARNVLIHSCRTIEMLKSRGIAATGVSIFIEAREQVVQLIPLSLSMIAVLTKRLNLSIKAITWAVEENRIPCYRTLQDAPSDLVVISPDSLFTQETVDRVEVAPLNLPMLAVFWSQIVVIIDLAVISYCGAHLVAAPEHYSALSRHVAPEIPISAGSLCFPQGSLACMSSFLQNKRIWVLQKVQRANKPLEGAFLSTAITELADVWGPVCQWTRDTQSTGSKPWKCYFTLGPGIIAACSEEPLPGPVALPDEALCHYLPAQKIPAPSEAPEIDTEK